jgi:hypothetical protein
VAAAHLELWVVHCRFPSVKGDESAPDSCRVTRGAVYSFLFNISVDTSCFASLLI